jgi:hypothetical protein
MRHTWPIACPIVATLAFIRGRYSAFAPAPTHQTNPAEARVAMIGAGPDEPWHILLHTVDQLTPGSTKAVNDLEALHMRGALVGTHAKLYVRLFKLARTIWFLGERISSKCSAGTSQTDITA